MLRGALRLAAGTATLAAGGWMMRALHGAPAALGADPTAIRAVAARSPHFRDGVFHNVDPTSQFNFDREQQRLIVRELLGGRSATRPPAPVPLATPKLIDGSASGLAVTWFGHSTALLEIDGYRVLTDPVWSNRCSPSDVLGPERMHPPPLQLEALPAVDAVVISHDHYDHLDIDTINALARSQWAPFVVPLGVGAHLRAWGIPEQRVIELDWGERTQLEELTLVCTPARHFSGRFLSRNNTLWASWALLGPSRRAYFGGDGGYTTSFAEIGAEHGPFDLTLMPVGAYNPAWPDIHMNPEEAVQAHLELTAKDSGLLVPIHWCTFRLAPHPWAEPIERLLAAAEAANVRVAVPRPGGQVDAAESAESAELDPWWRLDSETPSTSQSRKAEED
jgi:L-ascorbate metabolism protein UlaG (beta-lactamase superfamily)